MPAREGLDRLEEALATLPTRLGKNTHRHLMYDREMYFDLVRTKRELDWSPRYSTPRCSVNRTTDTLAHRDEILGRHNIFHHRWP